MAKMKAGVYHAIKNVTLDNISMDYCTFGNGKKILIRGNHDKQYDESLFEEICDYKIFFFRGFTFVLMHYPIMDWYKKSKGSIHIHGHLHSDRRTDASGEVP